jgi:hypothetical protein
MTNQPSANLLISQLLSKNPSLRLGGSYAKLKSHHFFAHFDWVLFSLHLAFIAEQGDESPVLDSGWKDCEWGKFCQTRNQTCEQFLEIPWEASGVKKRPWHEVGWGFLNGSLVWLLKEWYLGNLWLIWAKKGIIKVKNHFVLKISSLGLLVSIRSGIREKRGELFVDELFELLFFQVLDSIWCVFDEGSDFLGDGVGGELRKVVEMVAAVFEELDERVLFISIQSHFSLVQI